MEDTHSGAFWVRQTKVENKLRIRLYCIVHYYDLLLY